MGGLGHVKNKNMLRSLHWSFLGLVKFHVHMRVTRKSLRQVLIQLGLELETLPLPAGSWICSCCWSLDHSLGAKVKRKSRALGATSASSSWDACTCYFTSLGYNLPISK